ncbi:MAG: hypothetical protein GX410_09585 [Elusimicrobia bacterium]|nr:hypothetical protein [Elusimicrobiota bacterium]
MKTLYIIAALGILLCQGAQAADTKAKQAPAGNKTWFESTLKSMKTRVSGKFHSSGMKAGAVAAVRGDQKGEDAEKPYWKGGISEKAAKKLETEKAEFAAGLELAVSGKNDEAYQAFQKFLTDNPSSTLVPDVKEALTKLNPPAQQAVAASTEAAQPQAPAQPEPEKPAKK